MPECNGIKLCFSLWIFCNAHERLVICSVVVDMENVHLFIYHLVSYHKKVQL